MIHDILPSYLENWDLLIVGLAVASTVVLGFLVYFSNKESMTNKYFFAFIITTALWGTVNCAFYNIPNVEIAFWFLRLVLFFAIWQAFTLFTFFYVFPASEIILPKWFKLFLSPLVVLMSIFTLTPLVLKEVSTVANNSITQVVNGPLIPIFGILASFLVLAGIFILFKKARKAEKEERKSFNLILLGVLITFALIIIFNFIFPVLVNDSRFVPLGTLFVFPLIILTSYSILKYRLFNIKITSVALLVFLLSVTTFFEVILARELALLFYRSVVLLFVLIFGAFLIRGVIREVNQREEIEKLANKLQKINKRLRELDQMKNEFLSLATHQIRSPLTSMKGYVSMILEGDYGEVDERLKEPLSVVEKSSHNLVKVVNEFLDVSQIEQGKMEYNYEIHDIRKLVEDVVREYAPAVEEKGLKLNFEASEGDYSVKVDENKIEQVIGNLINNSIKYTLKGEITVKLSKPKEETVRLEVIDTGVGIDSEEIPHLFTKFRRAKGAYKVSSTGSGLGIYLAKMIAEAHGGNIRVHSEGEGKGSVFTVEIPIFSKE